MKKLAVFILFLLVAGASEGQTTRSQALELISDYNRQTEQLRISWPKDTTVLQYEAYWKPKDEYSWTPLLNISQYDSFFIWPGYSKGNAYDLWVKKKRQNDSASGYMHVGYDAYSNFNYTPDILLLIIDNTYKNPLANEINRLIDDLEKENWEVHTHYVQRGDSVQAVKRWVYDEWLADSNRVKSLYLLGHVPVPYSGNFNPDGHPDHQGAWPADVYYVTFDLNWTDQTVNTNTASRLANRNVPGDNKFDQDYIWPELAKIAMGRVDLFDMPAFGSDTLLIRRYLDKNHEYRIGNLQAENRALVDDNFGYFGGEAFAANGWRVFTPMFGKEVYANTYFSAMKDSSYKFSYACGGGNYLGASGVGSTSNFVNDSLLNPFTMIFGSYFGDWDNSNNFQRAPLASKGWGLASAWAGRPFWMFHHAALNQPIGLASLHSQNAWPAYDAGYSGTYVHIALMGDPSLKLYTLRPLNNVGLQVECMSGGTQIAWDNQGIQSDSVEIWFQDSSSNWYTQGTYFAADSSAGIFLSPGSYSFKIFAMDWVLNPSGFFKVLSHPLETQYQVPAITQAFIKLQSDRLCFGDTLRYSDSSISAGHQRNWTLDGQPFGQAGDSFFVPSTAGFFILSLEITDSNGCFSVAALPVQVNPQIRFDSLSVGNLSGSPACDSSQTLFTAYAKYQPINGRINWYWGDSTASDTQSIPGIFSETHPFYFEGEYTGRVYLSDSAGMCSISDSFTVFVAPVPSKPIITPGSVQIKASQQEFRTDFLPNINYHWSSKQSVGIIPGDSAHKITADFYLRPVGVFDIFLTLENQYSCWSDTGIALVDYLASVEEDMAIYWQLFPNPTRGQLTIHLENPGEILHWTLQDMGGKLKTIQPVNSGENYYSLDLGDLAPGNYILRANTSERQLVGKIIKY